MAFVSKKTKSNSGNTPDHEIVVKVNTSKGYVTLGRIGLFNESALHSKVAELTPEQLRKLFANAELSIQAYSRDSKEEAIQLVGL